MAGPTVRARSELMVQHAEARRRRERAALGSDEFVRASEEVARIEIAIARIEEPPPKVTGTAAAALRTEGAAGPPQDVADAKGGGRSAPPSTPVHGDASTAPANADPRRRTGKAAGVRAQRQGDAAAKGRRSSSGTS